MIILLRDLSFNPLSPEAGPHLLRVNITVQFSLLSSIDFFSTTFPLFLVQTINSNGTSLGEMFVFICFLLVHSVVASSGSVCLLWCPNLLMYCRAYTPSLLFELSCYYPLSLLFLF